MSLEAISYIVRALQLNIQSGVFIIEASRLEYTPFDLSGTLVITGVDTTETLLDQIEDILTIRFGGKMSFYLIGVSETGQVTESKTLAVDELAAVGTSFMERNIGTGGVGVQWFLVKANAPKDVSEFTVAPLVDVVAALRAPNGCPWDRLQTHSTLRRYLLEEVYEVLDAIDNHDMQNLREELGDVLLQIVFHTRLAEEQGLFTMQDVIDDISAKMIRRHPHVFNQANSEDIAAIELNWEALKAKEPGHERKTLLASVSKGLPALLEAQKLQEKVAKVGFDWDAEAPIWAKFEEEIAEFREAVALGNHENAELEGGDMLFSLINLLRWYTIGGENALNRTNNKFRRRFAYVERCVTESGRSWEDFSLDELDSFWESAKVSEQKHSLK